MHLIQHTTYFKDFRSVGDLPNGCRDKYKELGEIFPVERRSKYKYKGLMVPGDVLGRSFQCSAEAKTFPTTQSNEVHIYREAELC